MWRACRRFDYSIRFDQLGAAQRESVWRNLIAKSDLGEIVSDSGIANYALAYDTSAGSISNVLQTIKRMNPDPDEADSLMSRLMKPHCELMGIVPATDFSKNLDMAIMRRFTFKLEFGYLENSGKRLFFERLFKATLSDTEFADLNTLENLMPGDFRAVRQELFYLDGGQTNADRIAALKSECERKKDGQRAARIGFGL